MSEMPGMEKKHAYGGRQCMACGGMACKISYQQLRDMVEKKQLGAGGIKEGTEMPLGRMAKGGSVAADEDEHLKGIHKSNYVGRGNSMVGSFVKAAHNKNTSLSDDELKGAAKEHHTKVLHEMKTMKKPHGNFADGGPVASPSSKPSGINQGSHDYSEVGSNEQKARNALANVFGGHEAQAGEKKAHGGMMAEGGEMDMGMDEDDGMLMDQCSHECMEALKKGDKAGFKSAIQAIVMDCLKKAGG